MNAPASETLRTGDLVAALKAAAEPTRLRILLLLSSGELTVKDLTRILDQSQPRISRHLKLLAEAGLVERFRDGSWVYFHVSDRTEGGRLTRRLLEAVDASDAVVRRDKDRAEALKRQRDQEALAYFQAHAADWDRIRSLYVPESAVEAAMLKALGPGPFRLLVDLGTGTGRMLELFSEHFERALGYDVSKSMLAYAQSRLAARAIDNAEVRHADILALPLKDGAAEAVIMHQVLHFLADPAAAMAEAARILAPEGRLVVVDFAPHDLDFLREAHAHKRLGIPPDHMRGWVEAAGLEIAGMEELHPAAQGDGQGLTVVLYVAGHRQSTSRSAAPASAVAQSSTRLERAR